MSEDPLISAGETVYVYFRITPLKCLELFIFMADFLLHN